MIRQLDGDVNMEELAEVARLESGAATIENPLSVTAVQIVRAQAVAADAELPSGILVAHAFAPSTIDVDGRAFVGASSEWQSSMPPACGAGPMRARRSKRMDRRLSHWQCTFCRHETPLSDQASACGRCGGVRRQLGDSNARSDGAQYCVGLAFSVSVADGKVHGAFCVLFWTRRAVLCVSNVHALCCLGPEKG